MNFPRIAFKIEDRVYRLDATDGPAIRKIPQQDREHLITLLTAIQKQQNLVASEESNYSAIQENISANTTDEATTVKTVEKRNELQQIKTSQPHPVMDEVGDTSDADQIMARLIAQERSNSKRFDKNKAYLYFGGVTAFILFLLYLLM